MLKRNSHIPLNCSPTKKFTLLLCPILSNQVSHHGHENGCVFDCQVDEGEKRQLKSLQGGRWILHHTAVASLRSRSVRRRRECGRVRSSAARTGAVRRSLGCSLVRLPSFAQRQPRTCKPKVGSELWEAVAMLAGRQSHDCTMGMGACWVLARLFRGNQPAGGALDELLVDFSDREMWVHPWLHKNCMLIGWTMREAGRGFVPLILAQISCSR